MKSAPAAYPDVSRQSDRSQPPPTAEFDEPSLDPWVYIDPLLEKKWWLVAIAFSAALATGVITRMMPKVYRTEATIFLTPPTYATTLRPEIMSVEAYSKLAESEYILALVDAELLKTHADLFAKGSTPLAHAATFRATLSASREPQKPYLPLIGLSAETDSPEKAKLAANAWADIFVRQEGKLSEFGKTKSADFILSEFPKAERTLAVSENSLQQLEAKQGQELASVKTAVGVTLRKSQLEAAEFLVVYLQNLLATARSDYGRLKPSVAEIEKELKNTPQYLTVSKAMTDDAMWTAQAQNPTKPLENLGTVKLQSQEVNPVYTSLAERLARERVDLNAIEPRIVALEKQIASARVDAATVRGALLDGERKIADLERLNILESAGLKRAVEASKKSFEKLAEKIGEARIAKSEPDTDLKLGAYAELPKKPSGPRASVNAAMVGAVAFMIAAVLIVARSILRTHLAPRRRSTGATM